MVHVSGGGEPRQFARLGNLPGDNAGDVEVRLNSGEVLVAASADLVVSPSGMTGVTTDGRAFAVLNSGTLLISAPVKSAPAK